MVQPVKCFTCGEVLGSKFRYFLQKVQERKRRNLSSTVQVPEEAQSELIHWTDRTQYLTPDYDFATKTIEDQLMDELCLTSICCRTAMLTQLEDNNF